MLSFQSTTDLLSVSLVTLRGAMNKKISEEDLMRLLEMVNLEDIKRHVLQACRMTLYDASVPAEQRTRRAERLEALSQLTFQLIEEELASRKVLSQEDATHTP